LTDLNLIILNKIVLQETGCTNVYPARFDSVILYDAS